MPSKTVDLVNLWAAFEAKYPDGSIEDFCRYTLIKERESRQHGDMMGGVIPSHPDADRQDKRSKRLKLTPAGMAAIERATGRLGRMAHMMMIDTPEEDQHLCVQLLRNMELKLAARWTQDKTKSFDEVYKELVPAGVQGVVKNANEQDRAARRFPDRK